MASNTFGRYEIRDELGRGGMATVYHAYDPHFQRDVALKILPRVFMHDENFRARFVREARAVAALEHWAIVPVHDYGEQDEQPFFVMRFMPGGSLLDRIERGRLSLDEVTPTIERIAAALDFAHRKDVVHRDVKPANILFDESGDAYLSDFGIVKLTESTAQLTGSGIVGTPSYMAPEMMQRGGITPLIDVYALGVTLYQALTGDPPYEADTPMGTALAHTTQPIPNIVDCCPDLPGGIQAVIEGALAKDPADRYQSAGALAADLRRFASQAETQAHPAPPPAVESPLEPTLQEPASHTALDVTLPDAVPAAPEVTLSDAPPAPPAARQTAAQKTAPLPPTVKSASRGFPIWLLAVLALGFVAGLAFVFWPRGAEPAEEPPTEEPSGADAPAAQPTQAQPSDEAPAVELEPPIEAVPVESLTLHRSTGSGGETRWDFGGCLGEGNSSYLVDLDCREIRIAVENAYLPFNYIELGEDAPSGWDYDAWAHICTRLHCTPVFVEAVWDGMIQAVSDGQYDVGADGITITDERARVVDFSDGYFNIDERLLVRAYEGRFDTIEEFAADGSLIMGAQAGTTNYGTAIDYLPESRIQGFDQYPVAIAALLDGEIDAMIVDEIAGQGWQGQNADELKMIGPPITSESLGFAFPLGSDLVDPVNQALAAMRSDGTLETLNARYFSSAFTLTYDDIGEGVYGD
jgi:polar amino acid transport system substrate-binding protein